MTERENAKPVTMYRADKHLLAVIKVECPNGLHPACDADGAKIFYNTHFASESEAWKRLESELLAGVAMTGRNVLNAESSLNDCRIQAWTAATHFAQFLANKNQSCAGVENS